jgi:5'-nucleotidase/UDP-sugar diphosphatase
LDPARTYTLATNDYIAAGGDGYAVFRDAKNLIDASGAVLMATTVMDHVTAKGSVAPTVEGRVVAVQ